MFGFFNEKVSGGLNSQKQEQIESDEAFARRLQFQEIQGQTKPKGNLDGLICSPKIIFQ
jgi:hypothetical protein